MRYKNFKILFVIPLEYNLLESKVLNPGPIYPHLGIAYLSSILMHNNFSVKVIDMRLGYKYDKISEVIKSYKPNLIAVSCYSCGYKKAYELINKIKIHCNIPIVIGGPHASIFKKTVLEEVAADFLVKGEGEYTLLELCNTLHSCKNNFESIRGLIWRGRSAIVENDDRPPISDLDILPFPAFELFELKKYIRSDELPIMTSRGCPSQCVFCIVHKIFGKAFRARSPENVVAELEWWKNKGWKKFLFHDDSFTFDMKRAEEICELIIKKNLNISWSLPNGIRVDRVNEELLYKMKEAGCAYISYGIESGNDSVLKQIKKGITVEQAKRAINLTEKVGIGVGATFMIGHPTENYKKFLDTLMFAESMPSDRTPFSHVLPYPGSELFDYVKKRGSFVQPIEKYLDNFTYFQSIPIFETKDFPLSERKKAFQLAQQLYMRKFFEKKFGKFFGLILSQILRPKIINFPVRIIVYKTNIGNRILSFVKSNKV